MVKLFELGKVSSGVAAKISRMPKVVSKPEKQNSKKAGEI